MLNIIVRGGKFQTSNYWVRDFKSELTKSHYWQVVCDTKRGEVIVASFRERPNNADPDNARNMAYSVFNNMLKDEREKDGAWVDFRNLVIERDNYINREDI